MAHRSSACARRPGVGEVLSALAEGLDVGAAVRVFGHGEATITRWRDSAGQHARRLHERLVRHLHLPHVQVDEIRTRLRHRTQVVWLWLAVDPLTKLVPVIHLGPCTQESATHADPRPACRARPRCVPVVTSDGLRHYFYALTAHFGSWVTEGRRRVWVVAPRLLYGQVQKRYRARRLVRVTQRMLCGTREQMRATLLVPGAERYPEHGLYRTSQSDRAPGRPRPHAADLGDRADACPPAASSGVVAGLLSLCPAASLLTGGVCRSCRVRTSGVGGTATVPAPPRWRRD